MDINEEYYLVTLSSHLSMASIVNIEMRQAPTNHRPRWPDRNVFVHQCADEQQLVPQGGSAKPAPLHDTLVLRRGDFGDERQTERADKQFGYGQDEIRSDQ